MTTNFMDLWLRLVSESLRGRSDAQEALKLLGDMPVTPGQLTFWISRFMPGLSGSNQPQAFTDLLEESWRAMGVVPRHRYLELLERHDALRRRLERTEKELQTLRRANKSSQMPEQEVEKVIDLWEGMFQETLNSQVNWMRSWLSAGATEEPQKTDQTDQTDEAGPSEEISEAKSS